MRATDLSRHDTSALWQRGDLDGFTVILGLVREAEAIAATGAHIHRVADLCSRARTGPFSTARDNCPEAQSNVRSRRIDLTAGGKTNGLVAFVKHACKMPSLLAL
jgi:hypothetical protein